MEEKPKKLKIKTWSNNDITSVEHLLIEHQKLLLFAQRAEKIVNKIKLSKL